MTVKKSTTLVCNHCKKEETFTGDRPAEPGPFFIEKDGTAYLSGSLYQPPRLWYIIEPDSSNSIVYASDDMISGNFCSLECMRDHIIRAIDDRDNPKPMKLVSVITE